MGFLSPWFLIGALAAGLPLWLHLLRQHKRTPQPFSSLMFFDQRIQSSVKHRRLRYLLLLAMRLALLLLLALAFAQPFVNRTWTVANRRTLAVVAVDRSFSMRYGDRMQRAKAEAHRVIDGLPRQTLSQVVAVDAHVEALTPPGLPGANLKSAVDAIEPSDRASSFGEFARALRSMEQTSGMHIDVHFISDMQESSMPTDFHDLQTGPYISLDLHRVGEQDRPNWAVENVVAPATANGNEQTRLEATVAGWDTKAGTKRVSLMLDGKTVATKDVAVAANGRAPVEFTGFQVPYGAHRGEVRIEPADDLPQDDTFPFSIERQDPRKVLFLYASGRSGGGSLYYKTALESGTHGDLTLEALPTTSAIDQDFSRFAFVVLSDPGELDQTLADALCSYIGKGGAVLIAVGPNTARTGNIPLSKESFTEQRERQPAGYVDRGHPALSSAGEFENVQFSETARFLAKPDARVLAKFADGSPLLVEEHSGEGRKLIFASTFDNSTTDFALHSSFVPFVVQTGRYLAGTEDSPSSVVAGTPVALRQKSNDGSADVIGPTGRHELSLAEASRALSFDLVQSGFYEIRRSDGRRLLMAVHADRRESDLREMPDETLNLWRNTGDTSKHAETPGQQTETRPWTYWRYVLALALGAALLESVFANRYLAKSEPADGKSRSGL